MTIELWMVVATVALQWVLIMADATPGMLRKGVPWAVGNREEKVQRTPLHARVKRASDNLAENLPLFVALVLVVHVAGRADDLSALGAQVFFGARVAHAIVYAAGLPWIRTLLWAVSVVGMFMVGFALA